MISIDTNILLFCCSPSSPWNQKAVAFFDKCLAESKLVISDLSLTELYVLLRNPAVVKDPLSAEEAFAVIQRYLSHPHVIRAENAPVMDAVWEIAKKEPFARRRIYDVRLALTLQHHGVTRFATANVRDFQGLGFERVWNPLVES
jgi:toxin-antitoxin system PIN domain toxin